MRNLKSFLYNVMTEELENVAQAALYCPFGELIYEENAFWMLDTIPRYLFNAKELDEESGMYYYSARYYSPPSFISRDPLFEKYPFISPYAYCANNPVIRVDPTGETWYQVNDDGYISEMKDKDGNVLGANDDFDMLHAKGATPLRIDDRSIMNSRFTDDEGKYTKLSAEGKREDMINVANFLMDNTNVEWSAFGVNIDDWKGNTREVNYIYTSHQNLTETYGATKAAKYGGATNVDGTPANKLLYFIHSHPKWNLQTMKPTSGYPSSPDDFRHMDKCKIGSPNAPFYIRHNGNTKLYPFQ